MNPQTYAEAERLLESVLKRTKKIKNAELVVCPPFVWLTDISHKYNKEISFGAQDVFWGGYSGYFADPDGYLWEVAYNPFTDLT